VAATKVGGLLEAGAAVAVVAPEILPVIAAAAVEIRRRRLEPADLDGACFVVAAAPRDVNREVAAAAHPRGVLVNAVDDVENASAYLGGVVRRGGVTVALSTDGAAPALAGLLREALEDVLPADDDLEAWMTCARDARRRWLAANVPMDERRPLLLDALVRLYALPAAALEGTPALSPREARVAERERAGVGPREPK
jgi:uroporphyrin-III C-methyltransferase/precorrin-2 dehydrogenase/sirohydrochlorin ferrochelatase